MKNMILLFFVLYSATALSQSTFYHCIKNGKKIISDQPCAEQGAKETKRVDAKDLTPLSTMDGMSQEQRQQTVQGWRNQRLSDEQQRQVAISESNYQDQQKERRCRELWKDKEDVVAQLRQRNRIERINWLNERHRKINDEIYQLKCGN